jgi:gamma-glutamyl-gamma-aminobutyraldehyde dehydrogenase/4-guanidinobutyraldehyde dehydrogenase/NAD-dependent aldehyde dehydrogenase
VLNVVTGGRRSVGIGRHPDIDVVGFTGSTEVGKLFMKYSAESNMKPVWTECGGKGPNIVFADAPDLAVAAQTAAFMIFLNTGQVCAAASRLIVEESAHDQVLEIVKAVGQQLAPADPLERRRCWARSRGSQPTRARLHRRRRKGARVVWRQPDADRGGGFFIEATVFDGVRNMRIAQEEIRRFRRSPSDARGGHRDRQCEPAGLSGAIWTQISARRTLARALRCGSVAVNAYADDAHDMTVPFGGYKQSGFGRDKSLHALDKYTQLKTTG